MKLTAEQIIKLGRGKKLKLTAVRGKEKGTELRFDLLAGAVAIICNNNPDGISTSQAYTKILQSDVAKKFGRSISRNMVAARMKKLWAVGHIHIREEPIIIEGEEKGVRHIHHQGEETDLGAVQTELIIEGKFTKKRMTRFFRNAHAYVRPQNRFQEAVFDIMADDSDVKYPTTLEEYKRQVALNFTEELYREDRLKQLNDLMLTFCTMEEIRDMGTMSPRNMVIKKARQYSRRIWENIEEQMKAQQKMAASGLPYNEAEVERLIKKDPNYWKSVQEMKDEGKI